MLWILRLYKICMSIIPSYFWNCGFIQNSHVQKPIYLLTFCFTQNVRVHKTWCFCFFFILDKIYMSRTPIYFWNCGFIPKLHVHNTNLFSECWFYIKFVCSENHFIFGMFVLYKMCMSRKHFFLIFGFIPHMHVHNTKWCLNC